MRQMMMMGLSYRWMSPQSQWLRWGCKAAHHLQCDQWPALLRAYEAEEGLVVEPDALTHPGEKDRTRGSSNEEGACEIMQTWG